jgi:hypothetical protein
VENVSLACGKCGRGLGSFSCTLMSLDGIATGAVAVLACLADRVFHRALAGIREANYGDARRALVEGRPYLPRS